jgi:ubiquinone/menaquinone biosynthesis C-methylase UbiE
MHNSSNANALRRLVVGYRVSQALSVVARLGIADLLADGPRSIDDLAAATHTHARSLYRVLRLLSSEGVFAEQGDRHFALTPLAEPLQSNAPDSLHWRAVFDGAEGNWHAWSNLLRSIKSGEPAIKHGFGTDLFGYLRHHPGEAKIFNEVMAAQTSVAASAVLEAYDFSEIDALVDIGGGVGALLAAILSAYPSMRGVLYDQPQVVIDAQSRLAAAGVVDRCEIMGGDFFESVPRGGNAYLLKHVLHDWDDGDCQRILKNCRRAIAKGGRLLVVEVLIPPGNDPDYGKFLDLQMLVVTKGGRERTQAEYGELFESTGFALVGVIETRSNLCVIEGVPV